MQTFLKSVLSTILLFTVVAFQNCSDDQMEFSEYIAPSLWEAQSVFEIYEDQVLSAKLIAVEDSYVTDSTFEIIKSPSYGKLSNFDKDSGKFQYEPLANFFGNDSFEYTETNNGTTVKKIAKISVLPINDLPRILDYSPNFELNSKDNRLYISLFDIDDTDLKLSLAQDSNPIEIKTPHGLIKKLDGLFFYTPDSGFRGVDSHTFYVSDSKGESSNKKISISIANPFLNLEPAMAIRGTGCISCHAKVSSKFITDFGFGSEYFFAQNVDSRSFKFFDRSFGDHSLSWNSARLSESIIVPKAPLGFSVQEHLDYALAKSIDENLPLSTRNRFKSIISNSPDGLGSSKNLAEYIGAFENNKKSKGIVSGEVVEAESVYIGAPTAEDLKSSFNIATPTDILFTKDSEESWNLSGISLDSTGTFFSNTDTIVCDGDLFIDKPLHLLNAKIKTVNGCRIYSTETVFITGPVSYILDESQEKNKTNLQITSAAEILMGVGYDHCEGEINPTTGKVYGGWYQRNNLSNPLKKRLNNGYDAIYRSLYQKKGKDITYRSLVEARAISVEKIARQIPGLLDATCSPSKNRLVSYERLLLNAPIIHSRYQGQFTGVIIAEYALFSLSKFSFSFDSVFKEVPILPFIEPEKFLKVTF